MKSYSSWLSGIVFVSAARGLRFKSLASKIEHSVANGSPPQFLVRSCVAQTQRCGDEPLNTLHVSAQLRKYNEELI